MFRRPRVAECSHSQSVLASVIEPRRPVHKGKTTMASRSWKKDRAQERIRGCLNQVRNVEIKEYIRDTDLTGLGNGVAYRVDGVHLYVDILNLDEMLNFRDTEGVDVHRRTLRFLNLHYRAVRDILLDVDAIQVDFHNQRLHAVFAKPYGDEGARVHKAVATAQLICDVLARTGEDGDDPLPAAKVRVGIDSGKALAVNNGRRGSREPLFLGEPANQAAKRAGGGTKTGIYMTNTARAVVGWQAVVDENATALTGEQVQTAKDKAKLPVTADETYKDWQDDLAKQPIGAIEFYRHTPPFQTLDLEVLSPKNSRRQECSSVYADIDNFTRYISDRIDDDETAKDVVRALHVLRAELECVLRDDFGGCKIRFIGDCIHGILIEGTALITDDEETAKRSMLCVAAMRSSFALALELLADEGVDASDLGLAIGAEHGPVAVTRLGIKGEMVRCCISRSVLRAEAEQLRCGGRQTAVGPTLNKFAPQAFKDLFGVGRRRSDFDYNAAIQALTQAENAAKSASRPAASPLRSPSAAGAAAAAAGFGFPAAAASPSKIPPGFS